MPYVPKRPNAFAHSSVESAMSIFTGPICRMPMTRVPTATATAIHAVIIMPRSGTKAMYAVSTSET